MSAYTDDLRFNCTSPPLLPCPSPTHTTSDYHVEVCYKCRPMVEREGKLYCSDNSLGPSTAQLTVWSLLAWGCPIQKCQPEAFIK